MVSVVLVGLQARQNPAIAQGAEGSALVPDAAAALGDFDSSFAVTDTRIRNAYAYVVPQCYTQTYDDLGAVNSCYVCHRQGQTPNFLDDSDFQLAYEMADGALVNPWSNLFEDRSARIAAQSDEDILSYVRTSNYRAADGALILADRLVELPANWDLSGDRRWDGYRPDAYFNFDEWGFDRTPDGGYSGWRAFAYYPMPGTYWPTNGSAGDVLVRLPEAFRRDASGVLDLRIYRLNLAILEALIKRRDVAIEPVDETLFGVDLDQNGALGQASVVRFDWAPLEGRFMSYVGQAAELQAQGKLHLAAGLFPEGTEFMQTLRYLDIDETGGVRPAPRLKELRYARKASWYNYSELKGIVDREDGERREYENNVVKQSPGDYERGRFAQGWVYQGFIEDRTGALRPQTQEESLYCMGCHGGIGATTDTTFAFARKLDIGAHQGGWYHWSQKGHQGWNEPKVEIAGAGVQYEYAYYLMYTRSGNEYLQNPELKARFFDAECAPKADAFDRLHDDISLALDPSPERALALNKAYRTIVEDQDYIAGRDALLEPVGRVLETLTKDDFTEVTAASNQVAFRGCFDTGGHCVVDGADPVLDDRSTRVMGVGMDGPDGARYAVDWRGIIQQSSYSLGIEGVSFTFPQRLTLPTRTIVPLKDIPVCYDCHRIAAPIVDAESQVELPVALTSAADVRDAVADRLVQLTTDAARDLGARWSPDGGLVAFVSDRGGSDQIWLLNPRTAEQWPLTAGPAKHAWPEWSPDGRRLVYWGYDPTNGEHLIGTIQVDGQNARTLWRSDAHLDRPRWSPDGEQIALAAELGGNWDLWVMRADGSERTRLTQDAAMETNPLWSPDGKVIAYKVAPTGDYNLTIQNFMTFEQGFANPTIHVWRGPEAVQMNAWSPDGTHIAYTAEVISDTSGADRVTYVNIVSRLTLADGAAIAEPSVIISKGQTIGDRGAVFSPTDPSQVAFWAWDKERLATLWLYDLDTDTLRRLTSAGADLYPQWSPDGSQLLFESGRSGNPDLWLLPLAAVE